MSFATTFYNSIVRRNSVYVTSILVSAYAFGVGFDIGVESFWDRWNKGKQWKDIRQRYITDEE